MRVKSNARRLASARHVAARSSPSANQRAGAGGGQGAARRNPRNGSFGGSSSGRTTDSDSVNLGSNPSPPAKTKRPAAKVAGLFVWRGGWDHEPRGPRFEHIAAAMCDVAVSQYRADARSRAQLQHPQRGAHRRSARYPRPPAKSKGLAAKVAGLLVCRGSRSQWRRIQCLDHRVLAFDGI